MKIYKIAQPNIDPKQFFAMLKQYENYSIIVPASGPNGIGTYKIFTLGKCENCGGNIEEPNSFNVQAPELIIQQSGLTHVEQQEFPEIWACDECGGSHCDNCTCTHGKQSATVIDNPKTNEEIIRLANITLEKISQIREILEKEGLKNVYLMPKVWSFLLGINMLSRNPEVDNEFREMFIKHIKFLEPMASRMKKGFMIAPSTNSKKELIQALNEIEPILKIFVS